jgi:protein-tyrosine phosphatase
MTNNRIQMDKENSGFGSVLNFRDIGGIPGIDGRSLRKGIIYRSANPDRITRKDIRNLYNLGIRTIIDLRAPYEYRKRKKVIENVEVISMPLDFEKKTREKLYPYLFRRNSEEKISEISNSLYVDIIDGAGEVFRQFAEILLSPGRSPVLIHCQAGKDRTGIITALIPLRMGVEREIIVRDYLKSNDALLPYFRRRLLIRKIITLGYFPASTILFAISVKEKNIETVLDRVENHYGGPEAYLAASGFDMNGLPILKERLLAQH